MLKDKSLTPNLVTFESLVATEILNGLGNKVVGRSRLLTKREDIKERVHLNQIKH